MILTLNHLESRIERGIRLAIMEASKSNFYPHKIGAVVIKHGKPIKRATNSLRKHSFSDYYKYPHSRHAEAAVLSNINAENSYLFVARVNRKGEPRLAKPCDSCIEVAKFSKVKTIIYTISEYPYYEIMESF